MGEIKNSFCLIILQEKFGESIMQNIPGWIWSGIICFLVGVLGGGTVTTQLTCNKNNDVSKLTSLTNPESSPNSNLENLVIVVRDSKSKQGLKDVKVNITHQLGVLEARTFDDGTYRFQAPKQALGEITIILTKEGYQQRNFPINFSINPNQPREIDLELVTNKPTESPGSGGEGDDRNSSEILQPDLTKLDCTPSLPVTNGYPVSISKRRFKSMIYMVYGLKITCSLKNNSDGKQFTHLSLAFGISDSNYCPVPSYVALYLDGQKVGEYKLLPGNLKNRNLDITNKSDFSIDFVGQPCSSDGGVHFVKATLN
ncbi:MAG: hypothetical protein KME30_26165 [Iphinoe sp. HA4291-MV1]|jgi:hypothetical protein|nr:hypothetical protein [Iphinoe sp. HA4291-MV1]